MMTVELCAQQFERALGERGIYGLRVKSAYHNAWLVASKYKAEENYTVIHTCRFLRTSSTGTPPSSASERSASSSIARVTRIATWGS